MFGRQQNQWFFLVFDILEQYYVCVSWGLWKFEFRRRGRQCRRKFGSGGAYGDCHVLVESCDSGGQCYGAACNQDRASSPNREYQQWLMLHYLINSSFAPAMNSSSFKITMVCLLYFYNLDVMCLCNCFKKYEGPNLRGAVLLEEPSRNSRRSQEFWNICFLKTKIIYFVFLVIKRNKKCPCA